MVFRRRPRARISRRRYGASWNSPIGKFGFSSANMRRGVQKYLPNDNNLGPERKWIDSSFSSLSMDVAGSVSAINLVDQGTTPNQRVGTKINNVSVEIEGVVASTVTNTAKIMLVYDKQSNSALPTIGTILNTAGGSYTSYSLRNYNNIARFAVLKTFTISCIPQYSGSTVQKKIKKYIKLKRGAITKFVGTGAGIADVSTGTLLLVTCGNVASGCNFYGQTRVKYTDY